MKWYKKLAIALTVIFALFLILGIFMPRNLEIRQSRSMEVPVQVVYNLLNNIKTSKEWNPFIQEDPAMELAYSTIREGKGASMSWKSKVTGNGSNIYTQSVENKLIESDLIFEGMDTSYYSFVFTEKEAGKTEVAWTMKTRLGFPYNVMGPVFKYMIMKSYRKGLENIDKVATARLKNAVYSGHKISENLINERKYAINRKTVKVTEVKDFYTQSLGVIFQKVQNEGLTMTGKPVALFFSYDEVKQVTDMAAGAPINIPKEIKDLALIQLAQQQVAEVTYKGDYEGLAEVHEAIITYIKDRKLQRTGPAIEEYITDAVEEKDPKKYVTKVMYPIAK